MTGKEQIKILKDIAQTDVPSISDFENYCGACDNYPGNPLSTMLCPFRNVVNEHTEWKKLGCQYFWD